jgi:hypothetical protein
MLCILPFLPAADMTVVLSFEGRHSAPAVAAMKLETEKLLLHSGVSLGWRMTDGIEPSESFSRLAVVKFRGRCEMAGFLPGPLRPAARLGITYRMDGRVIPFSEVSCDEVRTSLATAHLPADPGSRELLYGRALGRVLAHELWHVLNGNGSHTRAGIMQKYLSAASLTGADID